MTTTRRITIAATALAAGIALAGCGGGGHTAAPGAAGSPKPSDTATDRDVTPDALDMLRTADAADVAQHVTRAVVRPTGLWVTTTYYPDADATAPAHTACVVLKGYALNNGIRGVTIRSADGHRLKSC